MDLVTLLLTCGAVARLTGLIILDRITFTFRDWIAGKADRPVFGFVDDLLACPWCLSIWVSAVVAPVAYFFGDTGWFIIPAAILTASQVAGMLTGGPGDEEDGA